MKILFVSNLFPDEQEPVRGLDNAAVLHELRSEKENEIRVIAPRPRLLPHHTGKNLRTAPRPEDRCFDPQYPQVAYVPCFGSRWNDALMKNGLRRSFSAAVNDWKPDVALGSWLYPAGCALSDLCEGSNTPLVLITQGSDTHQYLKNEVRRQKILKAIDRANSVICRSEDLARRLATSGAPREKLNVIYNGIDPNVFFPVDRSRSRKQLGASAESPILLFVGNLLPVKNPLFLLQAHAELNQRRTRKGIFPAKLHLIGQGPMEKTIRRETLRLQTQDHVELLGRREPDEIALRMNAANVFCLSSRNEGFPNVLLEAMACNLPVVSTDVGGIKEKIRNTAENRLVEAGSLAGFVSALEELLEKNSRPLNVRTELNWKDVAEKYEDCLHQAITSKGGRDPFRA